MAHLLHFTASQRCMAFGDIDIDIYYYTNVLYLSAFSVT